MGNEIKKFVLSLDLMCWIVISYEPKNKKITEKKLRIINNLIWYKWYMYGIWYILFFI